MPIDRNVELAILSQMIVKVEQEVFSTTMELLASEKTNNKAWTDACKKRLTELETVLYTYTDQVKARKDS